MTEPSDYGSRPFGLREIRVKAIGGGESVKLPAAQTLTFGDRVITGELKGDDRLQSATTYPEAADWTLDAGGISLEAYAVMTGRTASESGSTPNRTKTMQAKTSDVFPYFEIYGRSLGDGADSVYVHLPKCKLTKPMVGEFKLATYYVAKGSGLAVGDADGVLYEIVEQESDETLTEVLAE